MSLRCCGQIASAALISGQNRTTAIIDLFGDHAAELEALRDKPLDVEIKLHRERRSAKANALCWELCTQIGRAMTPPLSKEDVYRDAIRAVGEYDQYYIREEALDSFMDTRKLLGVGWFAEVVGDAPLRRLAPKGQAGLAEGQTADGQIENLGAAPSGWVEVFAYKGSSTYDAKAMSVLIDYLVDQAQQMELQIAYDLQEIEQIKEDWARDFAH